MASAEDRLAELLGGVDGPMWLVTVATPDERSGCLIGFATQVSIDPPRFLACLSKANHTFGVAMAADHLAVHVAPAEDPDGLAQLFGEETGDEVDKFDRCDWHEGPEGQPILDGCDAWFVGRVLDRHDLGDHVGFVLAPVAVAGSPDDAGEALRFDDAKDLDAGHPA